MKARSSLSALAALSFILSGCYPEERFWWSPQGDRAVVAMDDGLHLATTDGQLGAALSGLTAADDGIASASWLPDGTGFVCERTRAVKSWNEVLKIIPATEAKAVDEFMPAAMPLLEAATKLASNEDKLGSILSRLPDNMRTTATQALTRTYLTDPAPIEKLLYSMPKGDEIVGELRRNGVAFHVDELCVVTLKDAQVSKVEVLSSSLLMRHLLPKMSPKHPVIACFRLGDDEDQVKIEIRHRDGGPALVVSQQAEATLDWTPDGRSIVFMAPIGDKHSKLASIQRLTVVQASGALMKEPYEDQADGSRLHVAAPDRLADPELLATTITLSGRPRLQVLPDGRVLFAGQPVTLPSSGKTAQREPQLYLIATDGSTVQPLPTAPGELPSELDFFVASPDGKHIAVVESGTDAVAVVDVSTGKTQIVSPAHEGTKCDTIPAWRTNTELTFAALYGTPAQPKWMLWSEAKDTRCVSESWPASVTEKWLELPKPKEDH